MRYISALSLVIAMLAVAAHAEDFMPSTVPGLPFDNTHAMSDGTDGGGRVFRGSAPGSQVRELREFGITDILIFKNELRGEVTEEKALLTELGYKDRQIHEFPMQWKGIEDPVAACKLAVGALKILQKVHASPERSVFFHCTVGQDRTGMLAGLYRMLEEGWSERRAFRDEMCANGYAEGNPNKPAHVSGAIRGELTPVFLHVSAIIQAIRESGDRLSVTMCRDIAAPAVRRLPVCR